MDEVLKIMNRYNSYHKELQKRKTVKVSSAVVITIKSHSSSGSSFAHCYGGK